MMSHSYIYKLYHTLKSVTFQKVYIWLLCKVNNIGPGSNLVSNLCEYLCIG